MLLGPLRPGVTPRGHFATRAEIQLIVVPRASTTSPLWPTGCAASARPTRRGPTPLGPTPLGATSPNGPCEPMRYLPSSTGPGRGLGPEKGLDRAQGSQVGLSLIHISE